MHIVRPASTRGHAQHGWLDSRHSFSFADYHDPAHMGVGNLRVLNEDRVAPGSGFGTHGHRDMEIISVVLEGTLAHRDRMGAGDAGHAGTLVPGDVQRMSAGTGVLHSESNPSATEPVHFLQIWLLPTHRGIAPGYEQRHFPFAERRGRLALVAAPDGRDGALTVHADAQLRIGRFDGAERAELALDPARWCYVHVARGRIRANGHALGAGDSLTLRGEARLTLDGGEQAEVLVFDLAPQADDPPV